VKGSNPKLMLRNASVVLPDRMLEKGAILLKDGRIARVGPGDQSTSSDVQIYDLHDATLFPGFIDVHIHGAVGVDTLAATSTDLASVSKFLATQGVTAWVPTLVPAPQASYLSAVQSIDEIMRAQSGRVERGASVLGIHYEGPFVNSQQCGALHTEYFKSYSSRDDIERLPVPQNEVAVKMTTLAPEVEGGIELIRELRRRGWVISIGHTRATIDVLDQALQAGARHMTHFMNAMAPLHHRAPGPVGWGLLHEDVTCDVIADGVHLDPQVLRLLVQVKSPARLCLISDAIAAAGMGDGNYEIWGETIAVTNGRTRNRHGSIAGSVISMLDAVKMMRSLGVSEVEVAKMAASNPARLLGIAGECGSIEEGKQADVVALDSEGKVALTLINGEIAFSSDSF
jgi:N-acetylglucosamine-6-phosphate deacetylase